MQNTKCQPDNLIAYLMEQLDAESEQELVQHLDQCPQCRSALEGGAADEEIWQAARTHLSDQEYDTVLLSSEAQAGTEPDASETSFAEIRSVLASLAPTDDPNMLGRLGPYEIQGVVGVGGMGIVLKGCDPALDRIVAIKVLAPHLASSGAARRRFAREARAAAAVLHPNVMAIHSVSNEENLPYLVMPYVRGSSLQKRIDQDGPLSTLEITRVAMQIASGLAAAHEQGLVHRDIKPANMMLAQGTEQVAITDFGLARAVDDATMTRSGMIAGTPQYMSPEQAQGGAIDARSDLFSLGSLMYSMCTGHSPFRAENSFAVMRRIIEDPPRPIVEINPQIPDWLENLVQRLLAKDPEQRIQSASQVADLLSQCLAHLEQPSQHPLPADIANSKETQSAGLTWLMAIAGLVLLSCLSIGLVRTVLDPNEPALQDAGRPTNLDNEGPRINITPQADDSSNAPATRLQRLQRLLEDQQRDIEHMSELERELEELEQGFLSEFSQEH